MKKLAFIFCCSTLLISCEPTSPKGQTTTTQTVVNENDLEDDDATVLQLNEGKRWKINNEMIPYLLNSEKILHDYVAQNSTDYKHLAAQLDEQNEKLIASCSMEGAAHDALHSWLHPYLEQVEALANESDSALAIKKIEELNLHFETFHKYFE